MSGDDDFDDFLARRKPLFRRPAAHELEPPEDVDRLVLRRAREAIRPPQQLHEIRGPGWGMPLALAASVLVAVTIVLNVMVAKKVDDVPADIHQVAQHIDSPAGPNNPARAPTGLPANDLARPATPLPPGRPDSRAVTGEGSAAAAAAETSAPPPSGSQRVMAKNPAPTWRRDAQSWLAEIDKLRAQGKSSEADAELAEYKRQHRAYASSPDR